jgi:hypothetical protein
VLIAPQESILNHKTLLGYVAPSWICLGRSKIHSASHQRICYGTTTEGLGRRRRRRRLPPSYPDIAQADRPKTAVAVLPFSSHPRTYQRLLFVERCWGDVGLVVCPPLFRDNSAIFNMYVFPMARGVMRPHPETDGIMTSRHLSGGYKGHGINPERRPPWTSTTTTNRPSHVEESTMARGTKRCGSPLEGGSTKFILLNNRIPAPPVAHLQERTEVTEITDFPRGAATPTEGTCSGHFYCFLAPDGMHTKLQTPQLPAHSPGCQ